MQNVLRVLLTFAICISSCSQVRNIKNSKEPESFYSKVTKAVYGKTVTITTTNGDLYEGTDVIVAYDSTQWVLESSGERVIHPTDQIHKVRIKDHSKGMVGGFTTGLVIGVVAAVAVVYIVPESGGSQHGMGGEGAVLVLGTMIGSAVGAGVGAVRGHRDEYIMNPLICGQAITITMNRL